MKFSKAWLILLLFQLPICLVYSQPNSIKSYTFNLKYHNGFVLKHSADMAHLANQRPQGFELDVYRNTNGAKTWEQAHNYPIIGYSFQYFHMDRKKPLGDTYSLVIYYGKNIFKTPKSTLNIRIGMGPGFVEKRFDRLDNYKNNLISSRLNFALNGRINYSYAINDRWNINTGIGILHLSNGATKVPNQGINIPSVHIGLGFCPTVYKKIKPDTLPIFKKETQFMVSMAGGFKQVYPIEGPSYFISTLSAYVNRKISRVSGFNFGTDIFFDGSNKTILDTIPDNQNIKYFKWGVVGGYEFYITKVTLLTQLGFYLYDPLKLNKIVYQRVGLKYYFRENIFGIMALKLHFGQADLVEWGVGIKF